jgi:hypothetical protein
MQAGADFKYEVHYMYWLLVLNGHCHYLLSICCLIRKDKYVLAEALQFIWVLQRGKSTLQIMSHVMQYQTKVYKFIREYNLKITGLVDLISSSSISFVSWDCLSDVT